MIETQVVGGVIHETQRDGRFFYSASVVYRHGNRIVASVPDMPLEPFGNRVPDWPEYVASVAR